MMVGPARLKCVGMNLRCERDPLQAEPADNYGAVARQSFFRSPTYLLLFDENASVQLGHSRRSVLVKEEYGVLRSTDGVM